MIEPVEKKIDLTGQMILAAIPSVITQLYAFYRIKKFKKGVLVMLLVIGIVMTDFIIIESLNAISDIPLEDWEKTTDLVFQYIFSLIVGILLPLYFARKWTLEYNEKFENPS